MRISTEIGSAAKRIGEERAIQYVAEAGFDCWDFTMVRMCAYDWDLQRIMPTDTPFAGSDYLAFARHLKQVGLDMGITCNQAHAPFPSMAKGMFPYLERAIECTAEAGGKICVIHPDNNRSPEENAEMYHRLLPFAKSCGVKIATENMWNWDQEKDISAPAACSTSESFLAHLQATGDEYLVACLDIGHAEMQGSGSGAANMIRSLGAHLQALHIHDNDRIHDSHQPPFTMAIDFEEIKKALNEIRYQGDYTLEADAYLSRYSDEDLLCGMKELAKAARRFAEL